jgi:ubiquinone biosynthesis protein UbiJ
MGNSVEMQQLYNISTDPKQQAIKKARIKVILAEVSKLRAEIDTLNDELIELLS